ncbi:hypothetical protein M758_7G032200 [Ceratodon purpureus]|nr:hypothetical protein M758_7G032200 [Ceratodon purpureus]
MLSFTVVVVFWVGERAVEAKTWVSGAGVICRCYVVKVIELVRKLSVFRGHCWDGAVICYLRRPTILCWGTVE